MFLLPLLKHHNHVYGRVINPGLQGGDTWQEDMTWCLVGGRDEQCRRLTTFSTNDIAVYRLLEKQNAAVFTFFLLKLKRYGHISFILYCSIPTYHMSKSCVSRCNPILAGVVQSWQACYAPLILPNKQCYDSSETCSKNLVRLAITKCFPVSFWMGKRDPVTTRPLLYHH
jgi:hypothetical protein